uniref:Uncharacterized protein n=1 Tax=Denticeps clupeoides TaxID=299321 RepID=A0AAY4BXL8_9TELE
MSLTEKKPESVHINICLTYYFCFVICCPGMRHQHSTQPLQSASKYRKASVFTTTESEGPKTKNEEDYNMTAYSLLLQNS